MTRGPRLVILGKQGAGKGTQCGRIARHYVIPHISTGDMFRSAVRSGTPFGKKVASYIDDGNLVPDDVTVGVVSERLAQDRTAELGFILDGFPRTVYQAEELSKLLSPEDIDLAIDLEVPVEVVLRRLAGRRLCRDCQTNYGPDDRARLAGVCDNCGGEIIQRADDTEEAIRRRLELYESQTEPIITWYLERDMLVTVDGMGDPDEVTERIVRAIDRRYRSAR